MQPKARRGDVAPGTDERFAEFLQFRTNRRGGTAFLGRLLPNEGVDSANDHGLWVASPEGALRLVAREGDPAPGFTQGERFGGLAYVEGYSALNSEPYWRSEPLAPYSLDSREETAFYARLLDADGTDLSQMGIWSEGGGRGMRLVARTGMAAPGFPAGSTFGTFNFHYAGLPLSLNDSGELAFATRVDGPGVTPYDAAGVWRDRPDSGLELVIRGGDPAPGADSARFVDFGQPLQNNAGDMALVASLARGPDVDPTNDHGLWAIRDGALQLIFREGDQVPGLPAGTIFAPIQFNDPAPLVINAQGNVAFFAELAGPEIDETNDSALWVSDEGGLHLVAREGDAGGGGTPMPHLTPFSINLAMNASGQIAFYAAGHRGDVYSEGIWATDRQGVVHAILQKGDPLHHLVNSLGEPFVQSAFSIAMAPRSGGEDGLATAINDRGEIVFWADGSIYVSSAVAVPEPGGVAGLVIAAAALVGYRRMGAMLEGPPSRE